MHLVTILRRQRKFPCSRMTLTETPRNPRSSQKLEFASPLETARCPEPMRASSSPCSTSTIKSQFGFQLSFSYANFMDHSSRSRLEKPKIRYLYFQKVQAFGRILVELGHGSSGPEVQKLVPLSSPFKKLVPLSSSKIGPSYKLKLVPVSSSKIGPSSNLVKNWSN